MYIIFSLDFNAPSIALSNILLRIIFISKSEIFSLRIFSDLILNSIFYSNNIQIEISTVFEI